MARGKKKDEKAEFPGQCVWLTGSKRCLLRGMLSPSTTGLNPAFCPWHWECSILKSSGRIREEFSEWLAMRRENLRRSTPDAPGGMLSWTEQQIWEAATGQTYLPKVEIEARPSGVISRELNEMVLSSSRERKSLIARVLDGEMTGDEASAIINQRASEIVRSLEDESF